MDPRVALWRLNERHYGALQGLNKSETAEKFGEDQVKIWRRSYDTPPPPLTSDDPRHPSRDRRYAGLSSGSLPLTESLKETVARFLPYWHEAIAPDIRAGRKVLIAAHGNSLRALVKYLDNMSEEDIVELNIPTAIPLVYILNDDLKPLQKFYLGDQSAVQQAMEAVANQGKALPKAAESPDQAFDRRLLGLIGADAQRSEEPLVVRRQIERPARLHDACGRRDLCHCRPAGTVDEPNHRFEGHLHVETGFARLGAAGFHLLIVGDGSGDRVGQFPREPVHDVIHDLLLLTPPPGRDPGRFPIRTCKHRGDAAGIGRQRCSSV